jgi:hypothetical protein
MDRKIIHLVVEYDPGFGHEDLGAKTGIDGQGAGDGVAKAVEHAKCVVPPAPFKFTKP